MTNKAISKKRTYFKKNEHKPERNIENIRWKDHKTKEYILDKAFKQVLVKNGLDTF